MKSEGLKVLVPLDGSPVAETVLPALMPLVSRQPAELTLLRVIDNVEDVEVARKYLGDLERQLGGNGVDAVTRLEFGRPVDEILHRARPDKIDLLAMATHGRTGLRRAFMGSVAEGVLRRATVPVLLNRPAAKLGDWNRIVVPVDGSAISEAILDEAVRLAKPLEATVHVVRVSLPLLPTTDLFFQPPPKTREEAQPYVEEIVSRLAKQGVLAIPVLLEGFAAREIVAYASEISAGLIAMMTEGKSGFPRLLAGSVAEEVLRSAPCPVLVRRWTPAGSELHRPVEAAAPVK